MEVVINATELDLMFKFNKPPVNIKIAQKKVFGLETY